MIVFSTIREATDFHITHVSHLTSIIWINQLYSYQKRIIDLFLQVPLLPLSGSLMHLFVKSRGLSHGFNKDQRVYDIILKVKKRGD